MSGPPDSGGSTPATVPAEIAAGTLDAELAALLWLLVEGGVSLNVIGPAGSGREALRTAFVDLAGGPVPGVRPAGGHGSLTAGGGTYDASSLDELLTAVAQPPLALGADDVRGLGLVVVLGDRSSGRRQVEAAHYLRPVERDREGHLQRRPPAILAARDAATGTLEHFHWAIATELAARVGTAYGTFQRHHEERTALLAGLADAGIHDPPAVARAVGGYRLVGAAGDHERH